MILSKVSSTENAELYRLDDSLDAAMRIFKNADVKKSIENGTIRHT